MDWLSFRYVIVMRTTPVSLWEALTQPAFTRQYWFGCVHECDWRPGSVWRLRGPQGQLTDTGEVVESRAPHRLVLSWRNELLDWAHEIGITRATLEIEDEQHSAVRLSVTHQVPPGGQRLLDALAEGWPHILSSLKSLLETGHALAHTDRFPG